MKILITGNMGYIGPCVVERLRAAYPNATLIGYDTGYFGSCITDATVIPERKLDMQYFGDVRNIDPEMLQDVDVVVHLAAISNDPMGKQYEDVTLNVNYRASVKLAKMAKNAGARSFVFASSCSMYGAGGDDAKTEKSDINPLTAYAVSKALTEKHLKQFADANFTVTCLRFATACGMSPRLRLDLVLNDFVAGAVASGHINILSDGSPWRPLIHIKDMARAIEWATIREPSNGGNYLAINAGSNEWNFQVCDIAYAVVSVIKGTTVSINNQAAPDKRSYRVNFDLFKFLAPDHQPAYTLKKTIAELVSGLRNMQFDNVDFRNSKLMRLQMLNSLQQQKLINSELEWVQTNVDNVSSDRILETI